MCECVVGGGGGAPTQCSGHKNLSMCLLQLNKELLNGSLHCVSQGELRHFVVRSPGQRLVRDQLQMKRLYRNSWGNHYKCISHLCWAQNTKLIQLLETHLFWRFLALLSKQHWTEVINKTRGRTPQLVADQTKKPDATQMHVRFPAVTMEFSPRANF